MPDLRGRWRQCGAGGHHLVSGRRARAGVVQAGRRGDLAYFLDRVAARDPGVVIGLGSNLLVRDGGVPGVVIRMGRGFAQIAVEPGHRLRAGTVVPDAKLVAGGRGCRDSGLASIAACRARSGGAAHERRRTRPRDPGSAGRSQRRRPRGQHPSFSTPGDGLTYRHCGVPERLDFHRVRCSRAARRPAAIRSRWRRWPSIARPISPSRSAPAAPPSRISAGVQRLEADRCRRLPWFACRRRQGVGDALQFPDQ